MYKLALWRKKQGGLRVLMHDWHVDIRVRFPVKADLFLKETWSAVLRQLLLCITYKAMLMLTNFFPTAKPEI